MSIQFCLREELTTVIEYLGGVGGVGNCNAGIHPEILVPEKKAAIGV